MTGDPADGGPAAREQMETGTMIPGPGTTSERVVAEWTIGPGQVAVSRKALLAVLGEPWTSPEMAAALIEIRSALAASERAHAAVAP